MELKNNITIKGIYYYYYYLQHDGILLVPECDSDYMLFVEFP